MIFNIFSKTIIDNKIIFASSSTLLNVISINEVSFTNTPIKPYIIEVNFNNGGFTDIPLDILLDLTSLLDETVDIDIRFIFDIDEDVSNISISYTSIYDIMANNMSIEDIENIFDKVTLTEKSNTETPIQYSLPIEHNNPNRIKFWRGTDTQYSAIDTNDINNDTLYFITNLGEIYLGSVLLSSNNNVSWGNENNTQYDTLSVNGVQKKVSISSHNHIGNNTIKNGEVLISDGTSGVYKSSGFTINKSVPSNAVFTDTLNTTGSTNNDTEKLYILGAKTQSANAVSNSSSSVYINNKNIYIGDEKVATESYISGVIGSVMVFKDTVGTSGNLQNLPTENVKVGDTYRVSGTLSITINNTNVEDGDLIIATASTGTTATWTVVQNNIDTANLINKEDKLTESLKGDIGWSMFAVNGEKNIVEIPNSTDTTHVLKSGGANSLPEWGMVTHLTSVVAEDNTNRCVWFSHSNSNNRLARSDNFKYNPTSDFLTVGGISGYASKIKVDSGLPNGIRYLPYIISDSGNLQPYSCNGLSANLINGSATTNGTAEFILGNNKASGTVGNYVGSIRLYGTSSGYTRIIPSYNSTANISINLPSSTGTLALNNQSFYIGTTQVAINRASAALTLTGVNVSGGTGSFSGIVNITNTTDSTTSANGALTVSGGVGITKNLSVAENINLSKSLKLNNKVEISYNTTTNSLQFIFK